MPHLPSTLLCTIGTSLFFPNLESVKKQLTENNVPENKMALATAYQNQVWQDVASALLALSPHDRTCGAEINSIASMIDKFHIAANCNIIFLHSDTKDGRHIAEILSYLYKQKGHPIVQSIPIEGLQDDNPKIFRTKGLRNLARKVCQTIREFGKEACAINATGGYKAQIAIAVLLGQALGMPVFYKHERFDEIISFPPMPIAFDFSVWMGISGILFRLETEELVPIDHFDSDWDEKYESLVEREHIDGKEYFALSPAGQIFHESFSERFRREKEHLLPPPSTQKQKPRLEKSGWPGTHTEVQLFMQKVTDEVPFVVSCSTHYYNPDLPKKTLFHLGSKGIECIFSEGSYCVRFIVETTASTDGETKAAVTELNRWLSLQ